ncbi:MAG: hypothetical protein KF891_18175 [Rhizobacter sp.]|nr:hypothetical protein [Rhizobacter sp.]
MASVSSAGIGSGLDVESIVTKLMSIEQRPVTQLKTQASTIQTKISAYGQLQSALSTFRDSSNALSRATTWGATTASSSDTGVRVSTSEGAPVGNYAIEVTTLAAPQSAVTGAYDSADAPGWPRHAARGDRQLRLRFSALCRNPTSTPSTSTSAPPTP